MKTLNQKIKICRIDNEKIKDGEVLFRRKIYDQNGNYLRKAPLLKKNFLN